MRYYAYAEGSRPVLCSLAGNNWFYNCGAFDVHVGPVTPFWCNTSKPTIELE